MRWTQQRVCSVRHKRHIKSFSKARKESEGWLTLTEAAKMLRVSTRTLRLAIEGGEIKGEHPLNEGPWVINRKDIECESGKNITKRAQKRKNGGAVPDSGQEKLF